MEVTARINTPVLNARIKMFKEKNMQTLRKVGELVRGHLIKSWDAGKGGDGSPLSGLSPIYRDYKSEKTGRSGADMTGVGSGTARAGAMKQGLTVVDRGREAVAVTWLDPTNINKARGNFEKRPNILKLGDANKKRFTDAYLNFMKSFEI